MTRNSIILLLIILALSANAAPAATVLVRFYKHGDLAAVSREVPDAVPLPVAAAEALVAGPTPIEIGEGYETALPLSTKLIKATLDGETLTVDMSSDVLKGLDDERLWRIGRQFHSTMGDYPGIRSVPLLAKGEPLADFIEVSPSLGEPAPTEIPKSVGLAGLAGRKIGLGPSHGRYWNGSYWNWQRTDPCGYGEAVLEDTNSIRLIQLLYQYLTQDGANVLVTREMNESTCCNPYEGLPYWKMGAYSWLRSQGYPASVWAGSSGVGGEENVPGVNRYNDDIGCRWRWADYNSTDIYIAHHTNASGTAGQGSGTEVFYDSTMTYQAHVANSLSLATNMHNNTLNTIREMYDSTFNNRGVKNSSGAYGEIRRPNRPAVLVELAFHDYCAKDALYLTDDFFRSVAMWGMYKGICAYFGTTPTYDRYSCDYVSDTIPSTMVEGESYTVSVTFRNRGVLWRDAKGFRLGAVGESDPFTSATRHTVTGDVRPGNTCTFTFTMTAPAAGTYTTDWQMLREGVTWFGPTHSETVTVLSSTLYQKNWLLIGPYSSTSIETNSLGVDEASLWASPGVPLNGQSWQDYSSPGDLVDLVAALSAPDYCNSYAWSYIYSPTAKNVYMFTGSDDQIRIWLNGVKVQESLSGGAHVFDSQVAQVTLNAGWNRLLVKVFNVTGPYGFSLRFADDAAGSVNTAGLTWRRDDWVPTLQISTINGVAANPYPMAPFYSNNSSVSITGTAGMSGGPAPWTVKTWRWGAQVDIWVPVNGGPNAANWSETLTQMGHVRHHFGTFSATGRSSVQWNNSGGSNYFDLFVDNAAPAAPGISSATPTTTTMALGLTLPLDRGAGPSAQDGADEYSGDTSIADWYRVGSVAVQVRRDSTSGPVVADWGAITSANDSSLTPNTGYSYYIQARDNHGEARGAWHNYTAWQGPLPTRTLAETPVLTIGAVTETTVAVQTSGALTNATAGQTGTIILNQTSSANSGWSAGGHTAWTNTGLQSNMTYTFVARSRNANGAAGPDSAPKTACTLPPAPTSSNITCERSAAPAGGESSFTFTNLLGFGTGARPSLLNYAWTTQATHTFNGSEQAWTSGTLTLAANSTSGWYLHVQSENSAGTPNSTTLTLGPYFNGYQNGWLLIGPYSSTSIETNSLGVDEASLWASPSTSLNGDTWEEYDSASSFVDLAAALDAPDYSTAYAWNYVHTPTAKTVYLFTGSDDQIRIWLNGVKAQENLAPGAHVFDSQVTQVSLNAGWNRILVKVHNETGVFGFSLRFADDAAGDVNTAGLTWRRDDWEPTLLISTVNGAAINPAPSTPFFSNNPSVSVAGSAGMSGGPAAWTVRTRSWGSNNIDSGPDWLPVSSGSTSASWSHTATQAGHVRRHFETVSATGRASTPWNNTGGSNYIEMFVDNAAPAAPAITSVTPTTTSISLGLTVPLDRGAGPSAADGAAESINSSPTDVNANWYRVGSVAVQVRRGSTSGPVVADWGTGASATDSALTPNTGYSYYIQARDNHSEARGAWHNCTAWAGPLPACTLAETPSLTIGAVTATTIAVQTSGALTNPAAGQTATMILNQTNTTDSGWTAGGHTAWTSTGLQSNMTYTLAARSRNASGVTGPVSAAKTACTLPPAPTTQNITCDRIAGQVYGRDTVFTFTSVLGFGSGGKPSALNYAWTSVSSHLFDGSEQAWTSGTLALQGSSSETWYLHVQSENSEGAPNATTLTLGPFLLKLQKPQPPRLVTGTGSNGTVTLTWLMGDGAEATAIDLSGSGSGPWASASTGLTAQVWTDPQPRAPGEVVYYRVASVDELGQLSENNPVVAVMNSINGVNIWNYSTMAAALSAPSVLVQHGTVFSGSNDRYLHSFYSSTGLPHFTPAETGAAISGRPPVSATVVGYSGQLVFTGSQDTYVYAYDAVTGQAAWSVSLGSGNQIVGKVAGQIWAPVTVGPFAGQTRTLVLAPTYNTGSPTANMLVALDGATGQEVWRFAPGNLDIIPGSPALDTARSIAVFASYAGVAESQPSLWAIDTTSGQKIWSLALGHISTSPGMTLDGSMVYVADDEGVLYKVETATGQVVWTHVFGGEPYGAPWVHYTGSMLFLSDQDGKVWSILDQGSSAAINPAWGSGSGYAEVAGPSQVVLSDIAGKMYVGASDGKIWELSESTGAGSYIFIGGALGDPVVHRQASRLMFGSASGRIHCLTIPFVRCDELRVFGMETGTGLLYPDGPFDAYAYYGLRARAVWRGLGPGAHVQTIRWWTPSGQLYQQFSAGFSATGDGYPQEVSVDIPLAGTGAQRMPGQWMVEVFLDDTTTAQGTRYFILE